MEKNIIALARQNKKTATTTILFQLNFVGWACVALLHFGFLFLKKIPHIFYTY